MNVAIILSTVFTSPFLCCRCELCMLIIIPPYLFLVWKGYRTQRAVLRHVFSVQRFRVWCRLFCIIPPCSSSRWLVSNAPLGLTSPSGSPHIHPFIWVTLKTLYLNSATTMLLFPSTHKFPFSSCEKRSSTGLATFSSFICGLLQDPSGIRHLRLPQKGDPIRPEGHVQKLAVASGWIQWLNQMALPMVIIDKWAYSVGQALWDFLFKPWSHGQALVFIGYRCMLRDML